MRSVGMKNILNRAIRDEKGAALVLAIILLLVGGLISAALLGHMGTGILAGEVYETRTAELYAADAGVEDAVWKIQHQVDIPTGCGGDTTRSYNITNADGGVAEVNDKRVEVTITVATVLNDLPCRYRVKSRATGDGSQTEVEAYIDAVVTASGILDHVITTPCDYAEEGPTEIDPLEGEHAPAVNYTGAWPTAQMLSGLYWEDVKDAVPYYTSDKLDVKDYTTSGIEPLYREGTLDINNTGAKNLTVTLNGTVYVTEYTNIGSTNQEFILDLNGNTVFVLDATGAAPEDDPCNPGSGYALKIGGKCTLTGSGCIIAVGNIDFMPNLNCSDNDYILVLSISGKTYMHPNGDFYGTLAGNAEVYIQNGGATWTDYSSVEGGLNFPDLPGVREVSSCSIASWEVSPL
jgi:Tfp pilus assembly protein PilX